MTGGERQATGPAGWLALLSCLILAAALRIWGIEYGLPHPTVRPDEERIVGRAQTILATGDPSPVDYTYPGLMIYLNALALGAYAWIGQLRGHYQSLFDFLFDVAVSRPGLQYLVCRAVSVALGVATVVATFLLGRDGYRSQAVGLVAALCLATNYLHVRDSHFATVDVGMTFFVTLALLYAVRTSSAPSWKNYLLCGFFAGAAVAAKYNAALVILALAAACVSAMLRGEESDGKTSRLIYRFLAAAMLMVVVFAVFSPYSLLHFRAAFNELATVRRFLASGDELGAWVHMKVTLPEGFGWPFFLAVTVAIVRAAWLRRPADLTLLAFVGAFFLHVGGLNVVYPRYVVPLAPVLSVFAAELLVSFMRGRRGYLVAAAIVALVGPGLWKSIQIDRLLAREDTRLMASRWVSDNLPRRAAILVCQGYGAPAINSDRRRPPAFEPLSIPCSLRAVEEAEASYLVTHEHPSLWSSRISPNLANYLEKRGQRLAEYDPFREDFHGDVYYFGADSFYLPFSGLGSVERGGPRITIWKLSRDGALGESRLKAS
ncbi:MAG: ArnT family glycosyltransferase [Vicinamibacteria bacterium]